MPGDGGGRCPTDEDFEKNGFGFETSSSPIPDIKTQGETLNSINSADAELSKLQEQFEVLSKSKDKLESNYQTLVMRYANSEKEVLKLKKEQENSQKQIKQLMKDSEVLNQKNKQLSADKSRFSQIAEQKNNATEEENKRLRLRVDELQNELKGLEITKSQFSKEFSKEKLDLQEKLEQSSKKITELEEHLQSAQNEIEELKQNNARLQIEDIQNVQKDYDKLKDELASKEFIIKWTQDRVLALECECEQVRHNNVELLNDMSICRAKEAELLSYTQQVTEKNVSVQSKLSAMEAKISALEDENKKLAAKITESNSETKDYEKSLSTEKHRFVLEKQNLMDEIKQQADLISTLQEQLDEARGENVLLRKKHESSLKELNKELRRQAKDGCSAIERMSQSSRTSSCSSLNTLQDSNLKQKSPENNNFEKPQEVEFVMPDQQVLIDRIIKLQKQLAKKQEKMDFLQDHHAMLVDALQKKTKIIQAYAMSQDPGALSSEIADKNKAEVVRHGGVMASVFGGVASDHGPSLELSLEINSKLQAVLEDALLKNITLKENISTLGFEISKLSEENKQLTLQSQPNQT